MHIIDRNVTRVAHYPAMNNKISIFFSIFLLVMLKSSYIPKISLPACLFYTSSGGGGWGLVAGEIGNKTNAFAKGGTGFPIAHALRLLSTKKGRSDQFEKIMSGGYCIFCQ